MSGVDGGWLAIDWMRLSGVAIRSRDSQALDSIVNRQSHWSEADITGRSGTVPSLAFIMLFFLPTAQDIRIKQ